MTEPVKTEKTLVCASVKRKDPFTPPGKSVTYHMFDITFYDYSHSRPLYFILPQYTADKDLPFKAGTKYRVEIIDKPEGKMSQVKKLAEVTGTDKDTSQINTNYRINHMVARECAIMIVEAIGATPNVNDTADELTYYIHDLIMNNPRKYDQGQSTCNAMKLGTRMAIASSAVLDFTSNKAILEAIEFQFLRILEKYDGLVINPYEA